jgi:nucleotide-binding universal stress UspA family protein
MAFKDVLLVLITYPKATDPAGIQNAVSFAICAKARISAAACVVKVRAPHHAFSDAFIDVPALVDSEMKKSSDAAAELMARFEELARNAGAYGESVINKCYASEAPDLLVREARLRDLTILSAVPEDYNYPWYAESIIFGSGRPVLILSTQAAREFTLDRMVVAWDGSRSASRAVADALPLLERAKEVQVLTVLKEKELSSKSPARELTQYLQRRGIDARSDCIDAVGRAIGEVLTSELLTRQADLLIMGAYGHSRIREFILGGATRSMLSSPPVPLFLSH